MTPTELLRAALPSVEFHARAIGTTPAHVAELKELAREIRAFTAWKYWKATRLNGYFYRANYDWVEHRRLGEQWRRNYYSPSDFDDSDSFEEFTPEPGEE